MSACLSVSQQCSWKSCGNVLGRCSTGLTSHCSASVAMAGLYRSTRPPCSDRRGTPPPSPELRELTGHVVSDHSVTAGRSTWDRAEPSRAGPGRAARVMSHVNTRLSVAAEQGRADGGVTRPALLRSSAPAEDARPARRAVSCIMARPGPARDLTSIGARLADEPQKRRRRPPTRWQKAAAAADRRRGRHYCAIPSRSAAPSGLGRSIWVLYHVTSRRQNRSAGR